VQISFESSRALIPGILVAAIVAVAAQFLSEHYDVPAMLMALLLGIALNFLSEEGVCPNGIEFASKTILRIGVALLGVRISADLLLGIGIEKIAFIIFAMVLTILAGLAASRILRRGWRLGLLTGGSVAICGASAAIAIAAILPKNEHSERNLSFTILSVTLLSTVAMIVYPIVGAYMGLNEAEMGVFLGGTIHDVAQVIGAGFTVSQEAGDMATLVKLFRVAMLAPTIIILTVAFRRAKSTENDVQIQPNQLIPNFVLAFMGLAMLNSLNLIPTNAAEIMGHFSKWGLLVAIAAVGMRTSIRQVVDVGGQAIILIIFETTLIAGVILIGISWL